MKTLILIVTFLTAIATNAQNTSYQLSTHVLDILAGTPGEGVLVKLQKYDQDKDIWSLIDQKTTDKEGRIRDFLEDGKDNEGLYKLVFYTRDYYKGHGVETFYPFIEISFDIEGDGHFHVPITLSPYGYSTYKGR